LTFLPALEQHPELVGELVHYAWAVSKTSLVDWFCVLREFHSITFCGRPLLTYSLCYGTFSLWKPAATRFRKLSNEPNSNRRFSPRKIEIFGILWVWNPLEFTEASGKSQISATGSCSYTSASVAKLF
jgi:hypothetical protein